MEGQARSNPPLTEEEWTVLLDVYLRHPGRRLSTSHPALVGASEALRALARLDGRLVGEGFRSPAGLSRQLKTFADNQSAAGDTVRAPPAAAAVWARYSGDAAACHAAADRIRSRIR